VECTVGARENLEVGCRQTMLNLTNATEGARYQRCSLLETSVVRYIFQLRDVAIQQRRRLRRRGTDWLLLRQGSLLVGAEAAGC
jgi:hypothetical protein